MPKKRTWPRKASRRRKSRRSKSPRRKSPKRKSPKRKSPRRKSPRRKYRRRSRPKSYGNQRVFNNFFTKIFIINLFDKTERWNKVSEQFAREGIQVERFIAVDGRCKTQGDEGCLAKLQSLEMSYRVRIPKVKGMPLIELVPASSLTIGTIVILREMVKEKWPHVLICEDDVELTPNVKEKFAEGLKQLGNKRWDVLYLGCGNECGGRNVSWEWRPQSKVSVLSQYIGDDIYVNDIRDLRVPCDEDTCTPISENLSWAWSPGGTWAYAYSLSGARKMLKLVDNNAGNHIDQILQEFTRNGDLRSIAFDPPIIMHEKDDRSASDIPWSW